jgi:hypothetical protein
MTDETDQADKGVARCEDAFLDALAGCLNRDDFTEYSARRLKDGNAVAGRSRVYAGEKLDRVVITRYLLRRGQRGVVIFGYPRVEYEIPSFIFYFGGKPPTKTLAILDLVPPSNRTDLSVFGQFSERTRAALDLPATGLDFLRTISSPGLLHCAFKPLDPEDLLAMMKDAADIWRSMHIEPAKRDEDQAHVRERTEAILKMKQQLHANSPAIGIFTRAFGKEMSDVFARAEYGGHPCIAPDQSLEPPVRETWTNKKLGITWTADAQDRVLEAPLFVRGMIRRRIEQEAVALQVTSVTVDLVEHCERKYRKS